MFNFLGSLEEADYASILAEKQKLKNNKQIYFGHFPSSCIVAPGPGIHQLLEGGLVYLSGIIMLCHVLGINTVSILQ